MAYETIIFERKKHTALITLNRPERLNALGGTLMPELNTAVEDFNADPQMRAGILTGAGRAFCAGKPQRQQGAMGSARQFT